MSTERKPAGVLSVMVRDATDAEKFRIANQQACAAADRNECRRESAAARAAIAELIEAARRAAIAAIRGDGSSPGTIRNEDLDRLRAALAACRGGAPA